LTRRTVEQKRLQFADSQDSGCLILPNPWDVGSARMLAHLGFKALASTSTGFSWNTGLPDCALSRYEVPRHLAALNEAVDLPSKVDFGTGFAEDAAHSVKLAVEAGVAGPSVKDRDVSGPGLYGISESVDRIKGARAVIDESGERVVPVAGTEDLLLDADTLKSAFEKLVAFCATTQRVTLRPGAA
jgi:2-methylisocitrate lyase-like PEP mutase family enzyme